MALAGGVSGLAEGGLLVAAAGGVEVGAGADGATTMTGGGVLTITEVGAGRLMTTGGWTGAGDGTGLAGSTTGGEAATGAAWFGRITVVEGCVGGRLK